METNEEKKSTREKNITQIVSLIKLPTVDQLHILWNQMIK